MLIAMGVIAAAVLLISWACYRRAFYAPPRRPPQEGVFTFPEGKIYEPYYDSMKKWTIETRAMPYEEFHIRSRDGLVLYAKFYEFAPGAPIELMFHGYRGNAERDLSGGVQRCFKLGRSCLLVDQRCAGKSGGSTITFGIREHQDCVDWAKFAAKHFGPERKLILTGISMGAATVLMAAGKPLPSNVIGVLADCSYSTPRDIIRQEIKKMGLPPALSYPFVRLGARLFGGFDPDAYSPLEAVKKATVPVIFFHGEADDFVPCSMSRALYQACAGKAMLVTVPNAGHGLSYPAAPGAYLNAVREFFGPEGSYFDVNFLDGLAKL